MRRSTLLWPLALACLLISCGKSKPAATDSGTTPALSACLDRPETLPRPPQDTLPCELIPPGLSL